MMKRLVMTGLVITALSGCDEPVQVVNAPKDKLEVVDVAKEKRHAELQAQHVKDYQVECETALCEEIRALGRDEIDKTECKGDADCLEKLVFGNTDILKTDKDE